MKTIPPFLTVLFLYVVVAISIPAHGQQVSQEDARNRASQFMKDHGIGTQAATTPADVARIARGSSRSGPAYYVYNNDENSGFVVVSGDERTMPVLGYSGNNAYDSANVPEGLLFLLNQFVADIEVLDRNPALAAASANESVGPQIYPILNSVWGQSAPFYFHCPQVDTNYCVTGCTATAMAQVMYYYKWPLSTSKPIPSYTKDYQEYEGLPVTTFDWNAMKGYYSETDTLATLTSNSAISELMRYCGQSVEMNYGVRSSGGRDCGEVFVDYFRFSPKVRQLFRSDYSYSQWVRFIQNELEASRPIIYTGFKNQNSGHCFVCDGYDGKGYYHINWGWYGKCDGYFLLSLLNPSYDVICNIDESGGYNTDQRMIIGLEPDKNQTNEKNSVTLCNYLFNEEYYYTRNSCSDPFVITVSANHLNDSPVTRTYDMGWGVYENDGFTLCQFYPDSDTNHTLVGHDFTTITDTINFGQNLTDGTYYLRPVSRESGDAIWKPCHFSGLYFIRAEIEGDTLTLTAVNDGDIATDY